MVSVPGTEGSTRSSPCKAPAPKGRPQDARQDQKQDTQWGLLREPRTRKCFFLLQGQLCDLERCGPECLCFHGDITSAVALTLGTSGLMKVCSPYCREGDSAAGVLLHSDKLIWNCNRWVSLLEEVVTVESQLIDADEREGFPLHPMHSHSLAFQVVFAHLSCMLPGMGSSLSARP